MGAARPSHHEACVLWGKRQDPRLKSTPGLGKWASKQRSRRATMSAERKARLDALPWWVWRVRGGALELTV